MESERNSMVRRKFLLHKKVGDGRTEFPERQGTEEKEPEKPMNIREHAKKTKYASICIGDRGKGKGS